MKVGISELVRRIGDGRVQIQALDTCAMDFTKTKFGSKITFGTDMGFGIDGTNRAGLILWIDREVLKEAMREKDPT